MMSGWDNGWWILMWLWMAVFWLLVIGGIAWAVTRAGMGAGRGSASSAREVLDRRLASGEIGVEEYRRLKTEVGGGAGVVRGAGGIGRLLLAGLVGLAVLSLLSVPVWAVADGDWDMWDHMGGMMGGGRDTSDASLTRGGGNEAVAISVFAFSPGNLRVPVSATVTWTNRDSARHDATSRDGTWNTPTLSEGESASVTFDRAGEYEYYCSIHPSMEAHLSVK